MNYLELISKIIDTLKRTGHLDLSREIETAEGSASFGGELILFVGSKLLEMKEKRPEAFSKIAEDVEELISYANTVGLYPEWKNR